MPYGWTVEQIKAAIDDGTKELERRIQAHEPPEMIHGARQAMDTLYAMLEEGERSGQHGKAEGSGDAGNQGVCR